MDNDIFHIEDIAHEGGIIKASVGINIRSEIFKGHFPGQPVVPGACMMQLVKDVLESAVGLKIQLKKAEHLKFTSMIVPSADKLVRLEISYKLSADAVNTDAKLIDGDLVCFKFKGSFAKV